MDETYESSERCDSCGQRKRVVWPDGGYPEIVCLACKEQGEIWEQFGVSRDEDDLPW